ncbi:uncharacterized protein LOC123314330 [Coccinella septempunctata]|uniref:uncharacterized protein LOC123314330 n=1 Tax=Coccinella septempunctata TaxID=41139 RepID=UPI001D098EDA|nr:uncharacterized protein LOC123314330 [Coccinella septempunctata]
MARHVRWCSPLVTMCLIFGISSMIWIRTTKADCFYDDQIYEEGVEVETFEHCLNCTCTRGVLLCYLRVCPHLPNPPPVGCILLHRYRTCCPELICTDFTGDGNALESRSDPEGFDLLPFEEDEESEACILNGSVYAPGSAMDSSSHCEYCYCLRGKQTCVKPKCLLPIDGCTPSYDPNQCCPVQYNCSLTTTVSSTTTTMVPTMNNPAGGCLVENEFYAEGDKVLGVGHSACDNCYCLRGMLRCEPLSCAPPLLGCMPIIKHGECCAASYNCTGSIEINPEPNYGQYPIVSSEYSKLRKEQPKKPYVSHSNRRVKPEIKESSGPFYVIAESPESERNAYRNPDTAGTTRKFTGFFFNPSTTTPFYYESMIKEGDAINGFKHVTRSYPENKFRTSTLNDNDLGKKDLFDITVDARGISTTHNLLDSTPTDESNDTTETSTKGLNTEETTNFDENILVTVSTSEPDTTVSSPTENEESTTTTEGVQSIEETSTWSENNSSETITIRSVINTTDCINSADFNPLPAETINNLAETNQFTPSVEVSSSESTDVTEIDLQSSFDLTDNVSPKVKNGSKITSLSNVSKTKENDYDLDYNDPSLPPSLPNLHIIPFLAADALDSQKENSLYAQDKSSNDSFEFTNLFSPPVKTEGGFIPNGNPVVLETLYDNAVTMPTPPGSTENPPARCSSRGENILHGQSVPSDSPCTTCTCFYGNIVCQKVPCPSLGPNCRKSVEDKNLCCPLYICVGSVPENVPESSDASGAKTVTTSDPFKDVIKTKPAPDLQSLIVDMLPHFNQKPSKKTTIYITTLQPVTEAGSEKSTKKKDETLGLDKVLELLLGGLDGQKYNSSLAQTSTNNQKVPNISNNLENDDRNNSAAILKLAGCNIYGRMYRVGRIISELSGPCLECKCTEVGVQCKHLKC